MSDFPTFDDPAGKAALLTIIAATVWKIYLRLKSDKRTDDSADREARADAARHVGYGEIIAQLRKEVARLASAVDEVEQKLREEQRARFAVEQALMKETRARIAAEDRAGQLQGRVEQLEREITILRGVID